MYLDYPPRTQHREAGYVRQRAPGSVVILRLADSRPETIDAWYRDCQAMMASWQPDLRLRYLHDVRGVGLPTLYVTDRVVQVLRRMRYTPINDGRGAILITNGTLARLLESTIKARPQANWSIRCFADEDEALDWLRG